MSGAWRLAETAGGLEMEVDPASFADYRVAKREAMRRNQRRSHFDLRWVVIAPSGAVANTGPGDG